MNKEIIIIIFVGLGTIVIRCLPVLLQNLNLNPFWKKYLEAIPLAILTSLIFPSILTLRDKNNFTNMGLLVLIPLILVYLKLPVYLNLILSFFIFVLLSFFFL